MSSNGTDHDGDIRQRLVAALTEDDLNYDEVIRLAHELVKQDEEQVRFSTDAAIISRLGRELVSKQETAVSELIKNAYDADATKADLIFSDTGEPGGSLEILDDGNGMSRHQLIDGFMRLSSTDKIDNPISPRFNRSRAGRKGIGRFAAQRLGRKLEIVTQTEDGENALRVEIDWSEFEGGRDLATVANDIEQVPKRQEHGTTLLIQDLRDAWSEAAIRRIYRYTSDILQPFPLSDVDQHDDADPGFRIHVFRKSDGDLEPIADERTEVLDHSLATITGSVDGEGRATWSIESERLGLASDGEVMQPEGESTRYESLRNVGFKAFYFIYDSELIPHGYLTTIREIGRERGGIRLYRNGFRVLPYGEPADDWLHLDELASKRTVLPPVRNQNFFGFVAVKDPEGDRFEETSSREGLIENEAFAELRSFVHRTLVAAVRRVAEARSRKVTSGQSDWQEDGDPASKVEEAADQLVEAVEEAETAKDDDVAQARKAQSKEALEAAVADIVEELGMLRVLASLGLTIGEFTHEIKNSLGSVVADANFIAEVVEDGTVKSDRAERLQRNLRQFKTYSGYFDQAVARNITRELERQDLREVVGEFVESARPSARKYGIQLLGPDFDGVGLLTIPMHPSEWPAILYNLYTNAKKAIDRAEVAEGEVLFKAGRCDGMVYVEVHDNGVGIPDEHEERIFEPFFTTMPPKNFDAPEEEVLRGSGLGLKIVKDIVSSYDGHVYVSSPAEDFSTCIRIEIPRGSEDSES